MEFSCTEIAYVVLIRPDVFGDTRGHFFESWERRKFAAAGIDASFVQNNESRSTRHILRGLHYQIEQPQGKLVRVVADEVFDVAMGHQAQARPRSGVGRWCSLGSQPPYALDTPGFAHGF